MNKRQALFCTALVAFTACGDTEVIEPTQITARVYVADAIKAQPYTLRVRTARETGSGYTTSETRDYQSSKLNGYPVDLMVVPKKGSDLKKAIEIVVEARDAANTVLVQERALARFVANEQHLLELWLYPCGTRPLGMACETNDACHGATCQTCVKDTCGPTPTYGSLPKLDPDASVDPKKPPPSNRGVATSVDPASRARCDTPNTTFQCDNGNPCDGKERCAASEAGADENGCVREPARECGDGKTCDKNTGQCASCETNADGDGDYVASRSCGGTDCDDNDPMTLPTGSEICDGKDNDCNGIVDDGTASPSCAMNLPAGVTASCEAGVCVQSCEEPGQTVEEGVCVEPSNCPTPNPCAPGGCTGMGSTFTCVCGAGTAPAANGQSCREFGWRTPIALQTMDGSGATPRVAMNAAGNAVATWTQPGSGILPVPVPLPVPQNVWARRYTNGTWEAGALAETLEGDALQPDVGINGAGIGTVAFSIGRTVRLTRAPMAGAFATPSSFDAPAAVPPLSLPTNLMLSSPATGPQHALWYFAGFGLMSHRSSPDGTGASLQPIAGSIGALHPHIASNAAGDAAAVWLQAGTTGEDDKTVVMVSRFTQGAWSTPVRVDKASNKGDPSQAIRARVGIDDAGNVLVVWGGAAGLYTTRLMPGAAVPTWSPPVPIPSSAPASNAGLVMRPRGEALAVWQVSSGDRTTLRASLFTPPAAWSVPVAIDGMLEGRASTPELAAAATGAMVVVWSQALGSGTPIYAATYLPGSGFRPPARVSGEAVAASLPDIAIADNGTAIAVWQETGARTSIMAARLE